MQSSSFRCGNRLPGFSLSVDPHLTLACNICLQLGDTKSIPIVGDYTDITVQFPDKAPIPTGAVSIKFLMRGEVNLYSWWWDQA